MEHYRRTAHTRFDIKLHPVGITKYRQKLLRADVGIRRRQRVRDIGSELEVEIIQGPLSKDHVHRFVSCPPPVSASSLMRRIKGKTSRKLVPQFSHLNEQCWGRRLGARGFLVESSGVVTDEAIIESIRTQDVSQGDGDFRVDDESG
jgi:putative transposase